MTVAALMLDAQPARRVERDRLELLTALINGPSVDLLFRDEVIQIPPHHAAYSWHCVVAGCERPRWSTQDLCFVHAGQWGEAKASGMTRRVFVNTAEALKLDKVTEALVCRDLPAPAGRLGGVGAVRPASLPMAPPPHQIRQCRRLRHLAGQPEPMSHLRPLPRPGLRRVGVHPAGAVSRPRRPLPTGGQAGRRVTSGEVAVPRVPRRRRAGRLPRRSRVRPLVRHRVAGGADRADQLAWPAAVAGR